MILLALLSLSVACSDKVTPPYASYQAKLNDLAKVDHIEARIRDTEKRRNFKIFEKNRDVMSAITSGRPALFMAILVDEKPVLAVTNGGVGDVLLVSSTDYGKLAIVDFEALTNDVLLGLSELGLEFYRTDAFGYRAVSG